MYALKQLSKYSLKVDRTNSYRFVTVGTLKTPSVFISNCKWTDTLPTHILCLSTYLQECRDFWRVRHTMIRSIHADTDTGEG
jgi:hypothetical protein